MFFKVDEKEEAIVNIEVNSYLTGNKYSTTEVLTHEANLHGYKAGDNVSGKKSTDRGERDHDAIRNNNLEHAGYQQYLRIMEQLKELDSEYEKAFKNGMDKYR